MPYRDYLKLVAYFRVEPFPDPTRDMAQVCAVIANCNRGAGSKAWRTSDFLPRAPEGESGQTTEQMQAMFDLIGGS